MSKETVKNWKDITDNLRQFMRIIDNRNNKAFERLTQFSHWYYFPDEKTFAPNKFLRYKNTTLEDYEGEGYGKSNDYTLAKHFEKLNENSDEFKHLFSELKEFMQKIGKKLNASINIHIPKKESRLTDESQSPEEISKEDSDKLHEGAKRTITVNAYERNRQARNGCIEENGTICCVCGFDFEKKYGNIGKGFIHVHHLVPISEIGEEYKIDPIKDLKPVCPNCHSMLHKSYEGKKMRTPEELREMIKQNEKRSLV